MSKRFAALVVLVAVAFLGATASAWYVVYPTDGTYWYNNPNDAAVGDCYGNCGAGCSDAVNPCGGRTQYWELALTSSPSEIGGTEWTEQVCDESAHELYTFTRALFTATGHWTYHGTWGSGCQDHDALCPEYLWGIGCAFFGGCGWTYDRDWSYDDALIGRRNVGFSDNGSCGGGQGI
jgi:hypothetical protein